MTTAPLRSAAFKRPSNNMLDRALNRLLPPALPNQCVIIPTKTSLTATKRDVRIAALLMLATLALGLAQVALYHKMYLSVVLIVAHGLAPFLGHITGNIRLMLIALAIIMMVAPYSRRKHVKQPSRRRWPGVETLRERLVTNLIIKWKMAWTVHTRRVIAEEQWFREGADRWSCAQRIASSLAFGFGHISNPAYPLASFLSLSFMGYVLTGVYRQEFRATGSRDAALIRVVVIHRLYNRAFFCLIGVFMMAFIITLLWF